MQYDKGKHCVFYHRYHIVWSTKYRLKVLHGDVRLRIREIIRQVCAESGVEIIRGVLSSDHVHMFVSVPPKLAISDLVRKMKGRSSRKAQQEFPAVRKRYSGQRFSFSAMQASPARQRGQGLLLDDERRHHARRRTSVS